MVNYAPKNPDKQTKPESIRYVQLGGARPGIYTTQNYPIIRGGRVNPSLPVLVVCRSDEEAHDYNQLNKVLARVPTATEDDLKQAIDRFSSIKGLKSLMTTQGKFYPMRYGRHGRAAVYLEWSDIYDEVVNVTPRDFVKVDTFQEAFKFMVRRSQCAVAGSLGVEVSDDDIEAFVENLRVQDEPPASSATTNDSEPADSVDVDAVRDDRGADQGGGHVLNNLFQQAARKRGSEKKPRTREPSPAKSRVVREPSPAKARPASPSPSEHSFPQVAEMSMPPPPSWVSTDGQSCRWESLAEMPLPSMKRPSVSRSSSPSKASARAHPPPASSSASSMPPPPSPAPKQSTFPTHGPSQDGLFIKLRDSYGNVTAYLQHPKPEQELAVPRLGNVIDTFLDAFGYESDFIKRLDRARTRSRDVDAFARAMELYLTRTEAEWFWQFMDNVVDVESPFRFRRYST